VTVAANAKLEPAAAALAPFAQGPADRDPEALVATAPIRPGTRLMDVVRALDDAGVEAVDVQRREATLDDVFLTLTTPQPALMEEVAA
jgi:ABC-2 type transport system ATP-binding protein